MGRIALGAVCGLAIAFGMSLAWEQWQTRVDPCAGRCGDGTRCEEGRCRPAPAAAAPALAPAKVKRGRRGAAPGEPRVALLPADTKMGAEGDDLKRPSVKLDLTDDSEGPRELEQPQLDLVFDPRREELSNCVVQAVGDAPLETARVTVSFRVAPSGEVQGVRVEAPQLLLRNHVMGCVRPIVKGMRFPRAGGSTVVSYPFELK
jgi:hypothetical protein